MHNLSRRIAIALQHEERRCQYLTREAKLMLAVQDELTTMTESEAFFSVHTTQLKLSLVLFPFQVLVRVCAMHYVMSRCPVIWRS